MIQEQLFYLDDYSDEVMPSRLSGPTLEGWAQWLSEGGEQREGEGDCWTFEPPSDGATFKATLLSLEPDITAKRGEDSDEEGPQVEFSREPLGYDFAAIRWGPNLGWDVDGILDPGRIEEELTDPACPHIEPGDDCLLAVGKHRSFMLTYRAQPPRLEVSAEVQ